MSSFFKKLVVPNKLFIIMFIILNTLILYNTYLSKDRIDSYFRIHVVSNSDSIDDQLLKYKVAKNVDKYLATFNNTHLSKDEIKREIENNIESILNICDETIANNGYKYDVTVNIGKIYYDEKQKDDLYMDAGIYDSLQIVIGSGKGQNWWSLVFPYAFDGVVMENSNDVENESEIKTDDTNHISTYDIVSSDNITVKFGFLELISKFFN